MTLTTIIAGYLIVAFIAALIVLLVGSRLHRLSEHQKRNRQGGAEGSGRGIVDHAQTIRTNKERNHG